MKDKILQHSLSLAKKRKFGEAITLLEGEIYAYRASFKFYYILALSCLRAGDFGRAYTYFKTAHDKKNKDVNVFLGIAALNIRRGESGRAVDLYLKVLEIEPNNKKAKEGLKVLKKYGGSEELNDWVESGKIKKLYPPFPKDKEAVKRTIVLGVLALSLVLCAIALYKLKPILFPVITREGYTESALESSDREKITDTGGVYENIRTEKEILKLYDDARKNFNQYKDNTSRIAINTILLSNASSGIKNKARLILNLIDKYIAEHPVGFDNFNENIDFKEVEKDPALYSGCYVIWSGMAANVNEGGSETGFELLAGYEGRKELLGRVRVVYPFAIKIDTERPVEVLGRISLKEKPFLLEGMSFHQK